jgi:hypothetical protein
MRKVMILLFITNLMFFAILKANDQDELNDKPDFYLNLGLSYIPLMDYAGGSLIGLTFTNPGKSLGFTIRTDYLLSIGRNSYTDTSGILRQYEKIEFTEYNNILYLDLEYNLKKTTKLPLIAGLGYGWIYLGERENLRFNRDYGYAVISPKIVYNFSWISFELRGNIPLRNDYFKRHYNFERLFPIEISACYRFKPKQ